MAHEGYHEAVSELSDETLDLHRAIESLIEELEAVDWYQQRAEACKDLSLRAILELIEEARAAPVVDSRPLKVITDELWGDE